MNPDEQHISTLSWRRRLGWRQRIATGQALLILILLSILQSDAQRLLGVRPETRGKDTMKEPINAHRFSTLGLYITPPRANEAHFYDFFKACGYNYLEFCETAFGVKPELHAKYYADMDAAIQTAKKKGFKVWILLLAGMKQWKGEADGGNAGTFSALNKELLAERLDYLKKAVQGLPHADGFVFFAGDPGGDPEGRSTVQDCIHFAREVRQIVRDNAPKAQFQINVWAIGEWEGFPSPFSLKFWQSQAKLAAALAQEKDLLGPDCGIAFSLDNYYRSLTLTCYTDAGLTPPLYPQASDVQKLRERGVKPLYGWPYFLVDEVDDGFITPNNVVTKGQSQAETRYIRAILDHGLAIGLDGMIANSAYINAEPLNIYAFAKMGRSPQTTPEALLDEYAGFIADGKSKRTLAQVLRFIENHSNWENSLPAQYRLKPLDCGDITTAQIALERLATVTPRQKSPIVLPESPALYLKRLEKRLHMIAEGKIGGVAPIVKSKPETERK